MDDRQEVLEEFAAAAGKLVATCLSGLDEDKSALVAEALAVGAASICLTSALDPLIVSGWLQPSNDGEPALLFQINCDGPSAAEWN